MFLGFPAEPLRHLGSLLLASDAGLDGRLELVMLRAEGLQVAVAVVIAAEPVVDVRRFGGAAAAGFGVGVIDHPPAPVAIPVQDSSSDAAPVAGELAAAIGAGPSHLAPPLVSRFRDPDLVTQGSWLLLSEAR